MASLNFAPLWLSLRVSLLATLLVAMVGIPLAWLLARRDFRGKELLYGLAMPENGHIIINGRTYYHSQARVNLPPQQRHVGYVTQDYLLFPHMNVWQNVAFGLLKRSRLEQRVIIQEALAWLGLEELARQRPRELSGGQQQRVALDRALVTLPEVLLLDEPSSALDNPTRIRLRHDLLNLQKELNIPVLFVTLDLAEAFLLGEHMAVVTEGRLLQLDTPARVRERAADTLVAKVVGRSDYILRDDKK